MSITDWPVHERPRERLLAQGAAALSDAELLAIFLRVGVRGKSAVDLARDLVARFGSLTGLFAAKAEELQSVHGMGEAKYVQLQAVLEMSRRALGEEMRRRDVLSSPQAVRDWLRLRLASLQHEVFMVLMLDSQNCLIEAVELFRGTLTQIRVLYLRKSFLELLSANVTLNCMDALVAPTLIPMAHRPSRRSCRGGHALAASSLSRHLASQRLVGDAKLPPFSRRVERAVSGGESQPVMAIRGWNLALHNSPQIKCTRLLNDEAKSQQ